jgi:hypothetical protein
LISRCKHRRRVEISGPGSSAGQSLNHSPSKKALIFLAENLLLSFEEAHRTTLLLHPVELWLF